MCDYSLQGQLTRPAQVGDKLVTHNFGVTGGFAEVDDKSTAVCVLPGTEIAFDEPIRALLPWWYKTLAGMMTTTHSDGYRVAIFRQINKDDPYRHHDAVETPDGHVTLLTGLERGQTATVLQLPALPRTDAEAEAQRRVAVTG